MEQTFKRAGQDFAEIQDLHALQQRLLENNICVNGCGPLTRVDQQNRVCPVCGFKHFAYPQPRIDADAQALADHATWLDREAAGLCPNGHGAMVQVDKRNRQCPVCGHKHFKYPGF